MPSFSFFTPGKMQLYLLALFLPGSLPLTPQLHAQQRQKEVREVGKEDVIRLADPRPIPKPAPVAPDAPTFRKPQFRRGDANGDSLVDIADPVHGLAFLFLGGPAPLCLEAANSNSDHQFDISDNVFSLNFLFNGTRAPPAPGPEECGVDPRDINIGCNDYPECPDDFPLIAHVLDRITFGANVDLYTQIQTKRDLVDYIEAQLAAPDGYDQSVDEPALHQDIENLDIGFKGWRPLTARAPVQRVKSMLLANAFGSEWQLLHVVAQFWNNHFHTQIGTLPQSFFGRNGRGGGARRPNAAIFNAADTNDSGGFDEEEWNVFHANFPSSIEFGDMARLAEDGIVTLDEFLTLNQVGYWKYRGRREQLAVAADMERREYNRLRGLAFGNFKDLLESCSKSVAQLIYLNGFENTVLEPNENHAREFFELYGVGVDFMYTQKDVEEFARVLTGWTAGWVRRARYDADDINFQMHPESTHYRINLRAPNPTNFPLSDRWDDEIYTWAFVFGHLDRNGQRVDVHDWERKDLFQRRYGGVDSLGNPVSPANELTIAQNTSEQTIVAAMQEFELVLDTTVNFRDCAKFISTKLIQLLVTDDLALLDKTYPMPADLETFFNSVDTDGNGTLEPSEWDAPIPLVLPNGRPPEIFDRLDVDGNDLITWREYQEPDLLLDCIAAWQESDGTIREVVRTILLADEFLSLKFHQSKVKSPFEIVTSTVRALEATVPNNTLVLTAEDLLLAGMELFDFADPTGESELGFDWMHTVGLLERLKYINRAANPVSRSEFRASWPHLDFLAAWQLSSAARTVDFFTLLFHNGDILPEHRQLALAAYADAPAATRIQATVAFLLSLPQFQKQ